MEFTLLTANESPRERRAAFNDLNQKEGRGQLHRTTAAFSSFGMKLLAPDEL